MDYFLISNSYLSNPPHMQREEKRGRKLNVNVERKTYLSVENQNTEYICVILEGRKERRKIESEAEKVRV